ncbi:hypothetical protein ATU3B_23200 [Agrobacterium genomosp. 3 str. CIP 111-78]|uniref:Uncharacterized protein n=1 Tax=Agrobacterium tumefaciens TaxID=358 RepID=A0AAE6BLX7_AGRTU|nr:MULTISPECIES: hypothetical protein [Agrobacterium tumefaciens complex]MCA2374539.1 hypothetical protein [Agrobacterium tomkonis CIP 111-78]QCL99966.1 hypothetical protein CFBP6624_07340 [Agrobacterium tumefaciens]
MNERAKHPQKSRAYVVLLTLSVVYIGVYYLLIKETEVCDPEKFFIRAHWFHGFWDQYLACRSINELGDALAGAFAPVAFIWLAGTVFIQSQELQAQRQELNETQDVMRQQLEVATMQVTETKASTDLFNEQTQILRKQQIQRDMEMADAEFDSAVAAMLEVFSNKISVLYLSATVVYRSPNPEQDVAFGNATRIIHPSFPATDGLHWLKNTRQRQFLTGNFRLPLGSMCATIRHASASLLSEWPVESDQVFNFTDLEVCEQGLRDMRDLAEHINELKRIGIAVSNAKKHDIRISKLDETIEALDSVIQWFHDSATIRDRLKLEPA